MTEKEADKFTKSYLPSVKFYNMLDNDFDKLVNYRVPYCSEFSNTYDRNGKIKELCVTYINYLKNQSNILNRSEYINKNCKSFTYWLYDKLSITHNMNATNCSNALSEINNMWHKATMRVKSSDAKRCKPYREITAYHDKWDYAKKLFDYSMDFNYLKNMENNCNENCVELCNYLREIADIYKIYNGVCIRREEHMCPGLGIEYQKYNPEALLRMFKCDTAIQDLDIHGSGVSEEVEAEEKVAEDEAEEHAEEVISVQGEPSGIPFILKGYEQASETKKDESNHLSTFGNTLLGLVLSCMLFGVLYKVNENYINLYKNYYPSKSILHKSKCKRIIYFTCT